MNRRKFLSSCAGVALLPESLGWLQANEPRVPITGIPRLGALQPGQPVNLATYGEIKSWLNPAATPLLQAHSIAHPGFSSTLRIASLPGKEGEVDLGIEWPEFRTIDRVVIQYASVESAPVIGKQLLEYWTGITARQGTWQSLDETDIEGLARCASGSRIRSRSRLTIWECMALQNGNAEIFALNGAIAGRKERTMGSLKGITAKFWKSGPWAQRSLPVSSLGLRQRAAGRLPGLKPQCSTRMAWTWTARF